MTINLCGFTFFKKMLHEKVVDIFKILFITETDILFIFFDANKASKTIFDTYRLTTIEV